MIFIHLPWPNAALAPNRSNGRHWSGVAAIKAKAKTDAYMLAKQAAKGQILNATDKYALKILFIAPDKRRRDLDGCHGSIKHYLDGIAQALGVDDSQFGPVTIHYCLGSKPGQVSIGVEA